MWVESIGGTNVGAEYVDLSRASSIYSRCTSQKTATGENIWSVMAFVEGANYVVGSFAGRDKCDECVRNIVVAISGIPKSIRDFLTPIIVSHDEAESEGQVDEIDMPVSEAATVKW